MDENAVLAMDADELERLVAHHDGLYWKRNAPEIADTLYDLLVERLRATRPESIVLTQIGGGGDDIPDEGKVQHAVPMLSLDKCYNEDDLLKWFAKFEGDAVVSPKVDGVAISVRYDDEGALVLGSTRGSGTIGERVTDNVRYVHGIPSHIEQGPLEVRGEVYMPLSVFRERYAHDFANPRNLTAGAIKQKAPEKTGSYDIHFFAYDAIGLDIPTEHEKFVRMTELGFTPVPHAVADADGAQQAFDAIGNERMALDYETDGVVFKVNDTTQHADMGFTSHHPRYAIAYKFQGESGVSTLVDIEWSISRTGSINPVAIIAPIFLSGVTVQRVSLHNLGIMETLAGDGPLMLGSEVLVTRRGGVIPHLERVITRGDVPVEPPTHCLSCGAPTVRSGDFLAAAHTMDCATTAQKALEHFVHVIDAQGFGPKIIEQLYERELVLQPADFYRLSIEDLTSMDRLGRKSAQNLMQAIANRRRLRVATFLRALGIPDLGQSVSLALELAFESLDGVLQCDVAQLTAIDGVGPIIAQKVVDGLLDRAETIAELREQVDVFRPDALDDPPVEGALTGLSFVFTGEMTTMKRKDAQSLVKEHGGTCPSGVSGAVSFLVLGDGDHVRFLEGWRSSKLKKAEALGADGGAIRIVSESEFLAMVPATE